MRITWKPCEHITYVSDDEDQSGWQYLQVSCPDCGTIGTNAEDGVLDYIDLGLGWIKMDDPHVHQTTDMGPGGY